MMCIRDSNNTIPTVMPKFLAFDAAVMNSPFRDDIEKEYGKQMCIRDRYMTGGRVVVLGKTGKNFAAGMSGGIAYVLDEKSNLYRNLNKEMISIELVESKYDIAELKNMIEKHVAHTGSEKGKEIHTHFDEYLPKFKKIIPNDYKRMMMLSAQMEDKGLSSEQAQIEAFYESMRK